MEVSLVCETDDFWEVSLNVSQRALCVNTFLVPARFWFEDEKLRGWDVGKTEAIRGSGSVSDHRVLIPCSVASEGTADEYEEASHVSTSSGRNDMPQRSGRELAGGADMCRSLPHHDAFDCRGTHRAGLTGAPEHPQTVTIAAGASPDRVEVGLAGAECRAHVAESPAKDTSYRTVEPAGIGRRERVGTGARMEPCLKERFVDIDISEPGEEGLVQQQRFEHAVPGAQPQREVLRGECRVEGLGPEPVEDAPRVFGQPPPPEFPGVVVVQTPAITQHQREAIVGIAARVIAQVKLSGHTQVHEQIPPFVQFDHDHLCPPSKTLDTSAGHLSTKGPSTRLGDGPCPPDMSGDDTTPRQPLGGQIIHDSLHFRQLRHGLNPPGNQYSSEGKG